MSHSQRVRAMLRNPRAMMEFQATGRLPQLPDRERPSPLAALLLSLSPRDLAQIRNVSVGPDLGYCCRRQFPTAQAALNWLYPAHASGPTPADAHRDRRFEARTRSLSLVELAKFATLPPHLLP